MCTGKKKVISQYNMKASLPQPSSSELSMQSSFPSQRSSPGIQMWFPQVQSDSKQPSATAQFSSSEPVGHCFFPSQRADASTQPTEPTHGNWPGGHWEEPWGTEGKSMLVFLLTIVMLKLRMLQWFTILNILFRNRTSKLIKTNYASIFYCHHNGDTWKANWYFFLDGTWYKN